MNALKNSLLNSGTKIAQVGYSSAPTMKVRTAPLLTLRQISLLGQSKEQVSPLEQIFAEIEAALRAGLYHAALAVTLTLPDVCAALIHPKGVSPRGGYATWFDENLPEYAEALPGEEAYKMRCGFLHQARPTRSDMTWNRVAFGIGGPAQAMMKGNSWDGVPMPDTYILDIFAFCRAVVISARAWLSANNDNVNVRANLPHVVRRRPEGLPPLMADLTVIA